MKARRRTKYNASQKNAIRLVLMEYFNLIVTFSSKKRCQGTKRLIVDIKTHQHVTEQKVSS